MRAFVLAILASTALAAPAFAQDLGGKVYGAAGYTHSSTDIGGATIASGDESIETGVLTGRLGYAFTENFAIEGEGGIGIVKDTIGGVESSTPGTLGVFGVARAPVASNINLLGRMGYQHVWAKAEAGTVSVEDDDGSFAIGVGAEYMLDDKNGIRADYTRLTEGDGTNSFGLSFVRKF